ncbi:hypothetical protein [Streptomyces sp. CRN 30]|uniref:hypothetical protein n=1 Tax=Streptomyces sp. CRN 30 TaxID=3075613 RepID=UPI002A7EC31D|nr:hypothetical protein [Streptomyces sp. CRN 30]
MVLGSDLGRADPRRGRGTRVAAGAAALLLCLGTALAACGDDGDGDGDAAPTAASTAPASTAPSASAPADPAAAEREIKENWTTFFDPESSLAEKSAVLEDGDRMRPVLLAFGGDERGGRVGAEVTRIAFTSSTEADVTYTLTLRGATALPDAAGASVEQDGVWKVSAKTLCGLVRLSGDGSAAPVPGC